MRASLLVVAALSGCTLITDSFLTNEFSGDPDPIEIETESGAIVVGLRQPGVPDRIAVVDLLSPFTLTDAPPGEPPLVSFVDLTLLGKDARDLRPGAIELASAVPRAQLLDAQVIALHPCDESGANGIAGTCHIGSAAVPRAFEAIVGADVLAGDAVRLRLGDDKMFILADVGGGDRGRSLSCDAVFNSPYRGGGTVVIAGTELPFGNRRITVRACLGPDPDAAVTPNQLAIRQHGADALLVASTGIGITILGRTAYERYILAADPGVIVTPYDQLPALDVYMPSGLVKQGRRGTLSRIALVAAATANPLAPCRQVYAHRYLMLGNCGAPGQPGDCPCKNGRTFCAVPATMSLEPAGGVDVLVVPDDDPTLQALRTELRPDQAEVDGVLGTDALRAAEIDVDYPHDRLVVRCAQGQCAARPQLSDEDDRPQIQGCLDGQPTGPVLPDR